MKEEIMQAQNAQNDLQKKTKDFENQLANAQNEYISILGIFSAVVLAFVGGSMFSSSILENMSSTTIYRLILIADFLSFFVISLVYLLVSFIMKINGTSKTDRVQRIAIVRWWMKKCGKRDTGKAKQFFPIRTFYTVCLVVAILDMAAWAVDLVRLVDYLTKSLPWLK